jgi:hypothetical protein
MTLCTKAAAVLAALALTAAPNWAKPNIPDLARQCNSLGAQKACHKLASIAINDSDWEVRRAAVEALNDQALLARIALQPWENLQVRIAAAEKLTDQTSLATIAIDPNTHFEVSRAAIHNLTDQALLAKVLMAVKDGVIIESAIEKLTDQTLLAKVAVEAKGDAGEGAIYKLTDQALLARIAVEGKVSDDNIRRAVARLTDQTLLARIAIESSHVSQLAIYRLTNQNLLAEIAVKGPDEDARLAAMKKLTDQALLAKIAVECPDDKARLAAINKLTDQALLAKIAVEDKSSFVRDAATGRIASQAVLAKIKVALLDRGSGVQAAAKVPAMLVSLSAFRAATATLALELERGVGGDELRKRIAELADELKNIYWEPDAWNLRPLATIIVDQYRDAAANMGTGLYRLETSDGLRSSVTLRVGRDAATGNSSTDAMAHSNLAAARDNTIRMLNAVDAILSLQPDEIQRAVKEEMARYLQSKALNR